MVSRKTRFLLWLTGTARPGFLGFTFHISPKSPSSIFELRVAIRICLWAVLLARAIFTSTTDIVMDTRMVEICSETGWGGQDKARKPGAPTGLLHATTCSSAFDIRKSVANLSR